ncbi:N-methyl-L-tryptophan oxidase [Thorsellia anophelis]|nr:N-methyl-L-tryptophan oxidase [Thorsellia anophelis]
MTSQAEYDLIIIGSGSVGAAAGYYSKKAGMNVLMIDSHFPPHTDGSHHGQTRIIRHAYGEGENYVPLLLKAQSLWSDLHLQSESPIFEKTGVLNAAPEHSEFIQQAIQSAKQYNLNVDITSGKEAKVRWPEINLPDSYITVYEPNAGILYCENAIKSYIKLANELGCAQLFNCEVTAINRKGQGIEVITQDGTYYSKKVAVCAGTWVKKLLPDIPITPIRRVFAWHQADGRFSQNNKFPAFVIENEQGEGFYGFPAVNDELKLGKHLDWQPIEKKEERLPFGRHPTDGRALLDFLKHYLPGVGGCLYGASCTYDMTADEDFIIDTIDENIYVVSGLSGHGYKFASVLGEIISDFAKGDDCEFDLSPFKLNRFNQSKSS